MQNNIIYKKYKTVFAKIEIFIHVDNTTYSVSEITNCKRQISQRQGTSAPATLTIIVIFSNKTEGSEAQIKNMLIIRITQDIPILKTM